ncbi:N-acetylmuramoyl-L-alanine amidase [Corynebacterium sp. P6129]|uniref:peptidoglycan recognition protein family protein n=1 Tax=Corynebacterium antarcticum TaxID=2800405 RepID=UPI0022609FB6|nr:N-acetylmuramoyl-L-alanine amidase [Corynebacterium antarcticum]MCX7491460.1 N-acetylmuramoyl-L-alanine amidase [Corynebacterium antarcticum]
MALQPNPGWRGDPTFLPEVLRAFGVTVKEFEAWKDRGHGDFGRIHGVVAHHTGSNNTPASYIAKHPSLGLCAQIHLDRAGVATLVGAGVAWHAGIGSWSGWPPNANAVSIGIEAQSDGTSPWPDAELDAYYRICAAICWYLGLPVGRVIGHKEWAGTEQGKWDPGGIDMDDFRRHVQHYIDHPPHLEAPAPAPEEEAQMHPDVLNARLDRIEFLQRLILDQLVGPEKDENGNPRFTGWAPTDGKTLVDFVGALDDKIDALALAATKKETR